VGLSSEGGVRSHVRRGLDEGMTREELLHAVTIAIPTAGFPATAAAYRWALDVLDAGSE
jgi:4-carboxymuconolactone decarboxylase